jgi:hypothetical protein
VRYAYSQRKYLEDNVYLIGVLFAILVIVFERILFFFLLQTTAARTSPGFAGTAHFFRGSSSGSASDSINTVSGSYTDNVACIWTICV